MYLDFNEMIERELNFLDKICSAIELHCEDDLDDKGADESAKEYLRIRSTADGIVYDKRLEHNGNRDSVRLGGEDDPEVIRIKQMKYNVELLDVLKRDRKLLEKLVGHFIPYDPDTIDNRLKPLYRDHTGLVNKVPGILSAEEWNRIYSKRNSYSLPDDCNITTDGTKARSKSELVIYMIIDGYHIVFKFDVEITLKNDIGQTVTVCPDFIILCDDGSIIIIEHLGLLNNAKYEENVIKKIHLYLINGFKLNETLFLTADDANGKINAQAVDDLIRNMVLPKAKIRTSQG